MIDTDALLAPIPGAENREVAGIRIDTVRVGSARVRRLIYPPGFRWSTDVKPIVGTELCMHAHVGFLSRGSIDVRYADGCTASFAAPAVVAIDPGHDAWVVGDCSAILIELDFEADTVSRMGIPESHHHEKTGV
jgi:hypothetical protein